MVCQCFEKTSWELLGHGSYTEQELTLMFRTLTL